MWSRIFVVLVVSSNNPPKVLAISYVVYLRKKVTCGSEQGRSFSLGLSLVVLVPHQVFCTNQLQFFSPNFYV